MSALQNTFSQEGLKSLLLQISRNRAATWGALAIPFLYLGWSRAAADYRGWKDLGPGGIPYNIGGWMAQWLAQLSLGRNDTTSLACYDQADTTSLSDEERASNEHSYIGSLPPRDGLKATAAPWAIPQRQLGFQPDAAIVKKQVHDFNSIASNNDHILVVRRSTLERQGDALFLQSSIPPPVIASNTKGEVAHIHASADATSHVVLSFADAKEVIAKGWGERHMLSGSRILPLGYTMIYAPRDDAEVEIVNRIFKAGIQFMSGGGEVK